MKMNEAEFDTDFDNFADNYEKLHRDFLCKCLSIQVIT